MLENSYQLKIQILDDSSLYEDKDLLLIRPFTDITGQAMNAELIYYKLLKLMIECLLTTVWIMKDFYN